MGLCCCGIKKDEMQEMRERANKGVTPGIQFVQMYYASVRQYKCLSIYFIISRSILTLVYFLGLIFISGADGLTIAISVIIFLYFVGHLGITIKAYKMFRYIHKEGGIRKFLRRYRSFRCWDKTNLVFIWLHILFQVLAILTKPEGLIGLGYFILFLESIGLLIFVISYLSYFCCYVPADVRHVADVIEQAEEIKHKVKASDSESDGDDEAPSRRM